MSIQQKIRIIQRTETIVTELKARYSSSSAATHDLHKLSESLKKIITCLNKLDGLKPDQATNEIRELMKPIQLDNDILKGELQPEDYRKLNKGLKAVKVALKFHPTRYSSLEFVVLWLYEFVYFV